MDRQQEAAQLRAHVAALTQRLIELEAHVRGNLEPRVGTLELRMDALERQAKAQGDQAQELGDVLDGLRGDLAGTKDAMLHYRARLEENGINPYTGELR
jgi:uncharacterized coiled-coil protein SlyX